MEETTQININAVNEIDNYLFSVKDNGIGISSKNLDNIFTIFHRLLNNDEFDSTGIGLSIVKKIVHKHGGEIWLNQNQKLEVNFSFSYQENIIID